MIVRMLLMFLAVALPMVALAQNNDQFNDAYYLTEEDGPLDLSGEGLDDNEPFEDGGSGGGSSPNGSQTQSESGGGTQNGTSGGTQNGSEGGSEGGTSGGQTSETGGGDEDGGTGGSVETDDEAVQALQDSGAIDLSGSGQGGDVVIDGARVRQMIRQNADISDVLSHWRSVAGRAGHAKGNLTTGEYYALVAATIAGDDDQLERVAFTGGRFEFTYRSRGALFAFIPFSFPVQVRVTALAETTAERVQVRFPWYHWFMREYFTREGLAAELDSVVLGELRMADPETEDDIQARLLIAVADYVRQKARTISDSILLGSS